MGEIGIGTLVDVLTDLSSLLAEVDGEMATVAPMGDVTGLAPIDLQYSGPQVGVATPVNLGVHWLPSIDVDTPFAGAADVPSWADVAQWSFGELARNLNALDSTVPATSGEVTRAAHVATGTTIKAMSGFHNETNKRIGDIAKGLFQVDVLVASAANVTAQAQAVKIAQLEAQMHAVLTLAIPSLQAQVTVARAEAFQLAVNAVKLANQWSVDHVLHPVQAQIAADQAVTTAKIGTSAKATLASAVAHDALVAAGAAAALAPVATAVKGLLKESEDCVKPMCQMLGPKSPLGKALQALKLAALLALLAELAAMNEHDLETLIASIGTMGGGIITKLDQMFFQGTSSLGGTLGAIG